MTVIIPQGYAQATLNWESGSIDSGIGATVLGLDISASLAAGLDEIATLISSAAGEHLMPIMSDFQALASVDVVDALVSGSNTTRRGGTQGYQEPPPNVSLLVSMRSQRRGRRARGRNYWPGFLEEGSVDRSGQMTPVFLASRVAGFTGFFAELESEAITPVILQHTTPTGPNAPENPTPPLSPPPAVTVIEVQAKVATQRRRLR